MENQRMLLKDFCYINPKTELKKDAIARKISMADLPNNARKIRNYSWEEYAGGIKFKNNDTIMARITPCLENGKGGFVDILSDDEVAFGSTEYVVFRAKESVSHPEFIYYFVNTKEFRDIAIKSMTGTSGRQRVQTDLLADRAFQFPDYKTQERIAYILSCIDKKISLNDQLNDNLAA